MLPDVYLTFAYDIYSAKKYEPKDSIPARDALDPYA